MQQEALRHWCADLPILVHVLIHYLCELDPPTCREVMDTGYYWGSRLSPRPPVCDECKTE